MELSYGTQLITVAIAAGLRAVEEHADRVGVRTPVVWRGGRWQLTTELGKGLRRGDLFYLEGDPDNLWEVAQEPRIVGMTVLLQIIPGGELYDAVLAENLRAALDACTVNNSGPNPALH